MPCPIAEPGSMLTTIRHRVKLGLHPLQKPSISRPSLEASPVVDIIHSDGSAASGSYPPGAGAAGGSESSFNAQKGAVSFMQRIRTLAPSQQAADPPEGPATPLPQQHRVPGEQWRLMGLLRRGLWARPGGVSGPVLGGRLLLPPGFPHTGSRLVDICCRLLSHLMMQRRS